VLRLGFIVEALGGELQGDANASIQALAGLEQAGPDDLSFLSHPKYQPLLASTLAGSVILQPSLHDAAAHIPNRILVDQPYLYFAKLTQLWKLKHAAPKLAGIHPSAVVDPSAFVAVSATVGPLCVIEAGARVGASTVLTSRVTVGAGCIIGERCLVHSGVVIGADGFGFAPHNGMWEKIEQLGNVHIGDDVEIGANTCIDRGALSNTVIEDGVKLDNLIQIGHNVHVGKHTAMAGCVGVAGSARIGAHCTVGGGAVILGHLQIADGVNISASSVVTRSILKPGLYTGFFPIDENADWEKNAASVKQLHRLRERIRAIEQALEATKKP
jgi:UDP-3-O-[3-hydroxymyristoyl] glucosamine N-acyltransferase